MILHGILAALALLSLGLTLWQWLAARRFPLHQRIADKSFASPVTLLKPLKDADEYTETCLRSWFTQDYGGEVQVLFTVADAADPVCEIVNKLLREFPQRDAQLVVCAESRGVNAKVSKLAQLQSLAKHSVLVISDADVRVPPDLLANLVVAFQSGSQRTTSENGSEEPQGLGVRQSPGAFVAGPHTSKAPEDWRTPGRSRAHQPVGLANCFYCLANPATLAMRCEAVAINADFWSQVLQSRDVKPLDFALGAVMAVRRESLDQIGGFAAFADHLADDYQLGNRVARADWRIELCPVVVECWDPPKSWRAVWAHQLRWARTIRVCQPLPYFFSILSNATLWPLLWALASIPNISMESHRVAEGATFAVIHVSAGIVLGFVLMALRIVIAQNLQSRLTRSIEHAVFFWLVPVKDLMQAAVWLLAFTGNRIEWRGERYRLRRDGRLEKA